MMNLKQYMEKAQVSRKKYVDAWIDMALIPGAVRDEGRVNYSFPDSSRRPYRDSGLKPGVPADKLRAHIVKAAVARQYISAGSCFMTQGEFDAMVDEMVAAGIVQRRTEDGVTYIDSTLKSDPCKKSGVKEIRRFVMDCLQTAAKAAAEGLAKGLVSGAL